MPIHTVYTCDLCPTSEAVAKSKVDAVPLPEGWMVCSLECGAPVLPAHLDGLADAAAAMAEDARQWGVAFLESDAQPFFSNFYLCPECQSNAVGPLLPMFNARLKERTDIVAADLGAAPVSLDVIEGDEDGPPPSCARPPVPRAFASVPKEPT